jgi:hypothetical protein
MKPLSIRIALLAAFAVTSPLLTFAGGQPARVHMLTQSEMQDRTGIAHVAPQGKGTGVSRNHEVLRANAWRSEQSSALSERPVPSHPNWSDTAFSK